MSKKLKKIASFVKKNTAKIRGFEILKNISLQLETRLFSKPRGSSLAREAGEA